MQAKQGYAEGSHFATRVRGNRSNRPCIAASKMREPLS
jgi:hypothetical protein